MRVAEVLGEDFLLQHVLAGAIFAHRGWGSWALTPDRDANVAEIERRARARGLPLRWPRRWPPNALTAQRAAIFAKHCRVVRSFAEAAYLATYGEGGNLEAFNTLLRAGESAGLDGDQLAAAVVDPAIKAELRDETEAAIALGVIGVPTLRLDRELYFGGD
jgi:2-hydroxychromene-2-carboxylate isomerase